MKAQIVSFHCVLRDKMGRVISSTFNREVITQTTKPAALLKGLADGLSDLRTGEKRTISLSAQEAYGYYNPRLVSRISRGELSRGATLRLGDRLLMKSSDNGEVIEFRVVEEDPDSVVLDGNHPLAGQDLVFDIETLEARDASEEEIAESEQLDHQDVPAPYMH